MRMKRYDNPSMALDMKCCDSGEYILYEDALRLAIWCIELADEYTIDYSQMEARSQLMKGLAPLKFINAEK
tara:strand:- start:78 stop:290 length:213 start_codon:yes stop_codon:yes gene_type:complete